MRLLVKGSLFYFLKFFFSKINYICSLRFRTILFFMEQTENNYNFQGKWKREIPEVRYRYSKKRSRKKKKNILLKILNDFIDIFRQKKFLNTNRNKRVNSKRKKSREAHTLSTKFILKRAFENSLNDIKNSFNILKQAPKSRSIRKIRLEEKFKKKRKEKLAKEIKEILTFKKKNISKDEIFFRKKLREKRINDLKERLKRYSKLNFARKKSTSEIIKKRLLREKRKKQIRTFYMNFKTLPSRTLKEIIKFYKDFKTFFRKTKNNWRNIIDYIKVIRNDNELKNKLLFTYFNSTTAFLFSYLSIYYLNQLITVIVSSAFSIPTVLYYFDIIYQIGPYSSLWNRFNIIVINGAAPFFSLLLAVIYYRFYKISKDRFKYFRLYFFWGMIFSFNMFFGAYLVGAVTRSGFIYFTEWIFFSYMFDIEEIIFMVTSVIALIAIGYFASHFILTIADTKLLITNKNKPYYKFMQLLLPYITVITIINIFSIPNITFYNILLQLSLLFIIIPSMFNYESYRTTQIVIIKTRQNYSFLRWSLIITVLLLIIIRFILNDGIWFN